MLYARQNSLTHKKWNAIIRPSKLDRSELMDMRQIFLAFTGEKTRSYMADVFSTTDISVSAVCGTGMELLERCRSEKGGVVLSGYALYDMTAEELYESLPKGFSMMVLAEKGQLEQIEAEGLKKLCAPIRQAELIQEAQSLFEAQEKPRGAQRSEADKALIAKAKLLLMEQNTLSEEQAYRFIQKRSMDMGAKMVQTAQGILSGQICI